MFEGEQDVLFGFRDALEGEVSAGEVVVGGGGVGGVEGDDGGVFFGGAGPIAGAGAEVAESLVQGFVLDGVDPEEAFEGGAGFGRAAEFRFEFGEFLEGFGVAAAALGILAEFGGGSGFVFLGEEGEGAGFVDVASFDEVGVEAFDFGGEAEGVVVALFEAGLGDLGGIASGTPDSLRRRRRAAGRARRRTVCRSLRA
jgi:hypothetical protein